MSETESLAELDQDEIDFPDGLESPSRAEQEGGQFQFSSVEDVAQSLPDQEQWEKIVASSGGDYLRRDSTEWIYKESTDKESSITNQVAGTEVGERHGKILGELYTQGFSVAEYSKGEEMFREVYFADERGRISYEIYSSSRPENFENTDSSKDFNLTADQVVLTEPTPDSIIDLMPEEQADNSGIRLVVDSKVATTEMVQTEPDSIQADLIKLQPEIITRPIVETISRQTNLVVESANEEPEVADSVALPEIPLVELRSVENNAAPDESFDSETPIRLVEADDPQVLQKDQVETAQIFNKDRPEDQADEQPTERAATNMQGSESLEVRAEATASFIELPQPAQSEIVAETVFQGVFLESDLEIKSSAPQVILTSSGRPLAASEGGDFFLRTGEQVERLVQAPLFPVNIEDSGVQLIDEPAFVVKTVLHQPETIRTASVLETVPPEILQEPAAVIVPPEGNLINIGLSDEVIIESAATTHLVETNSEVNARAEVVNSVVGIEYQEISMIQIVEPALEVQNQDSEIQGSEAMEQIGLFNIEDHLINAELIPESLEVVTIAAAELVEQDMQKTELHIEGQEIIVRTVGVPERQAPELEVRQVEHTILREPKNEPHIVQEVREIEPRAIAIPGNRIVHEIESAVPREQTIVFGTQREPAERRVLFTTEENGIQPVQRTPERIRPADVDFRLRRFSERAVIPRIQLQANSPVVFSEEITKQEEFEVQTIQQAIAA